MKKNITVIFISLLLLFNITANEYSYPFIYIPGMFDNGDKETKDSLLVKNLNNENGFYYNLYFKNNKTYNKEAIICSSNIVKSKYNRLSVANLIGPYRTNISLWLMSDRLFCLMHGKAPKFKNYYNLTNYEGNDFQGFITVNNKKIQFKGIVEEIWAKYGRKVYYKKIKDEYFILINKKQEEQSYYLNENGYFDSPDQIKFNFVVHSSGGIALRRYIQMCEQYKINNHINLIVNLSVPQKGARMMYELKKAFPVLISHSMDLFYKKLETGNIKVEDASGDIHEFTYKDLDKKTKIRMLYGQKNNAIGFRKMIGNYILYNIAFDGHKRVLGTDPALYDLHPDHLLIKTLNNAGIPREIPIYNFRVKKPYAKMFVNISKFLKLEESDGVVDYKDTEIVHIPGGEQLIVKDYIVEKANHIPFPYIEPVFNLRETVDEYYGFLKILLNTDVEREDGVIIIYAVMKAIMTEMGLDLEYLLENEDYSVIDYYADNPVEF